ncbi:MAG: 3-octaprenyl-4-hydroxybenzoate carboxy-lyase [Cellvibrionales bacterium TMED49]|nr:3-octaprenyl-4-hydroxybenzoate carboxy-lyase [Porticoccaceae bacterium]OUU35561.1 MAG: 3-octaprenyl-4-hydroxybenzoate carboxy-lyase [Cellvibrionales bacterium TMED49]
MRLIVGMSGSSGVIYGIRLLQLLAEKSDIETHLVMSPSARMNISIETGWSVDDVESLADMVHSNKNIGASIASGSFKTSGMIIAPCSMKTLSGVVNSFSDTLLIRAADVVLKERRKLILVPRETPLHSGHCELLLRASRLGASICPPVPAFYNQPSSIQDIIDHTVKRLLDLYDIDVPGLIRWKGSS